MTKDNRAVPTYDATFEWRYELSISFTGSTRIRWLDQRSVNIELSVETNQEGSSVVLKEGSSQGLYSWSRSQD